MRRDLAFMQAVMRSGGLRLAGADPSQASFTLLPDGSCFLRCRGPAGLADGSLVTAMAGAARGLVALTGTLDALRSLMDIAVLGFSLAVAAFSVADSAGWQERLWHATMVAATYLALVPARRWALRTVLNLALRLAFRMAART